MISLDFLSLYTSYAAFRSHKTSEAPGVGAPAGARTAALVFPVRGEIVLAKVPRVKFVHSDAQQKDIHPRGRLRPDFEKGALYGGVVLRLTLLAAGPRGFP